MSQITTTTDITADVFESAPVRSLKVNQAAWFMASDVCKVLGLTNTSKAIADADLHADELNNFKLENGPGRPSLILSRSGVNKLILNSRKPAAQRFKNWIARDVIPSIQDHGMYAHGLEGMFDGLETEQEIEARKAEVMAHFDKKLKTIVDKAAEERRKEHADDKRCRDDAFRYLAGKSPRR